MQTDQLDRLSRILKALTNPTRLRVLLLLQGSELPVNQICQRLAVERTHISHMLAKLTALGLLQARRAGKQLLYSAVDSVPINPDLIKQLSQPALVEITTNSMQPSQPRSIVP
ncbi:MAG: ArsR family transcriptional regulator [Hymenobacter sp.]|nr:MAG: ArsR family transcriptional regulator [Hymenobacter sp.]